jgi:hypothetical protein
LKFDFHVGERERHEVAFSFNVWGRLVICVDGAPIVRKLLLYSLSPVKRYKFRVGSAESHEVVIEKRRKVLLGGAREQTYKVLVDGNLSHQFRG